mgnify:CR=1 FL=1
MTAARLSRLGLRLGPLGAPTLVASFAPPRPRVYSLQRLVDVAPALVGEDPLGVQREGVAAGDAVQEEFPEPGLVDV